MEYKIGQTIRYYYSDLGDVYFRTGIVVEVLGDSVIVDNGNIVFFYEIIRVESDD